MLYTVIIFIVILGILVFVHELGHFLLAKKMGMAVEEFGFGFPPRLFGWRQLKGKILKKIRKKGNLDVAISDHQINKHAEVIQEIISDRIQETETVENISKWQFIYKRKNLDLPSNLKSGTIYSINALPFGGFVKIKGEQGDSQSDQDSFAHKKIWQRAIVLSAGVLMNFALAILLFSVGYSFGLPSVIDKQLSANAHVTGEKIQIVEVSDNSPAALVKLHTGDVIVSVDGKKFNSIDSFQNYIKPRLDQELAMIIQRENQPLEVKIIPKDLNNNKEGLLGVWLAETGLVSYPWYYAIWMGIKTTGSITWQILVALFNIIKNLVTAHPVGADIAGPVGIAVLTGQVARMGFIYILQFTALLSINLGIINFLPIPALDGGRLLFLLIAKIKGRPVNQKIEAIIHNIGFLVLIGLILLVTFRDISHFSGSIKSFLGNIF